MPANRTQSRLEFGPAGNWNAIEARARDFVNRWKDAEGYERGQSQDFWRDLLEVFGVDRKRVNVYFEYRTRKLKGDKGYVDLFWPGKLVAEQKSAGRDLNKAITQALDYMPAMLDHELPKAIVASDFRSFDIVHLDDTGQRTSFTLEQLPDRVRAFSFLFDLRWDGEQDPVNGKAARDIANLHEDLKAKGYRGADLEVFLARIVFCLFAEDTGIFDRGEFSRYVRNESRTDGSNLGRVLLELFEVLDTPNSERMQGMPATLASFPYVNGGLFAGGIKTPHLDTTSRSAILTASLQDWAEVNPSIFGSMFQGVMDEVERRNLGAHYTSEKNILRLIQPLFLDDLYVELEAAKGSPTRLDRLHDKLANLKFLDPACGSGNFLVITYRELRKLEHLLIQEKLKGQRPLPMDIAHLIRVTPDQMAGIELEEFPAKVAQLALWLTDHQMNRAAAKTFGGSLDIYARIPISSQPNIVQANALRIDWGDVVELSDLDYIIGNPPFIGAYLMTSEMRDDLKSAFPSGHKGTGAADFVTGWFAKAGSVMERYSTIRTALVATNSISQGEQVGTLWSYLYQLGVRINFAHSTFKWRNEAPGVAAVFCVIIGFSMQKSPAPRLFLYEDIKGEPIEVSGLKSIGPYLYSGSEVFARSRSRPLCDVPGMTKGSIPVDGGNLLFTHEQFREVALAEPATAAILRQFVGATEFINGTNRWCFWADGVEPQQIRQSKILRARLEAVAEFRRNSKKAATRAYADQPALFMERRQPVADYLLIPRHTSENRQYIPIGFMAPEIVASDATSIIPNATRYHFGILTSQMHMAWMRLVAGRLEGRYRYSKDIVYNNFPWPENVSDAQRQRIEELAQAVLDARAAHPTSTLADLYDPLSMPPNLRKAHNELDRAVDRLYRSKPFTDDAERVALLLKRYQALTAQS